MFLNICLLVITIFVFELLPRIQCIPKYNHGKQIENDIYIVETEINYETMESIRRTLKENHMKINYAKEKAARELLSSEIIEAIKSGNYSIADRIIQFKLGVNSWRLNMIVQDVYANNISNFKILIDYAWKTSNYNISCRILDELWLQMKYNKHTHLNELCEIYQTLIEKVINPEETDLDTYDFAVILLNTELGPIIVEDAVDRLKSHLLEENYLNMYGIANKVANISQSLFNETISRVINQSYGLIRFRKLLYTMWSLGLPSQKASALTCIFWQLYPHMKGNPDATMIIAYYIKKLKNKFNLTEDIKNEIDICIEHFSESVKNLYFEKSICLRNVLYQSYLSPNFVHDEYKHGVFSQLEGTVGEEVVWHSDPVDECKFKFNSKKFKNESLYTGDEKIGFFISYRVAFTRNTQDNSTKLPNNSLTWFLQLYDNEFTIANQEYRGEFLCLKSGKGTFYADAVSVDWDFDDKSCRWIVEQC